MTDTPFELTIRCGCFATQAAAEQEGKRILQDLRLLHLIDQPDACSIGVTAGPIMQVVRMDAANSDIRSAPTTEDYPLCACAEFGPCPIHA